MVKILIPLSLVIYYIYGCKLGVKWKLNKSLRFNRNENEFFNLFKLLN